jgi:hypothetical protein
MQSKRTAALLLACAVGACASLSPEPPAQTQARVLGGPSGFTAIVGPCTIITSDTGEGALVTALAMGAIERGFDLFSAALIAAGDPNGGKAQQTAEAAIEISAADAPECLFLARGRFAEADTAAWRGQGEPLLRGVVAAPGPSGTGDDVLSTDPAADPGANDAGASSASATAEAAWPRLVARSGFVFADRPDFFAEIAIERSANGRAIRFVPNFVAFERPMRSFAFRTQRARSIAIDLTLYAPGPETNAALSTHLELGRYEPGARAIYPRAEMQQEIAQGYTRPFASPWLQLPQLAADTAPHNLRIALTEIQDPNVAAAFAGEVLKGARQQFLDAAGQAIDPERRAAAELTRINARYDLQRAYNSALVEACSALVALQNAPETDMLNTTRNVAEKQMNANAAAQAASLPAPFPQVTVPSLRRPTVSLGACGTPPT